MRLTWNAIARLAAVASVAAVLVGCRADQNKGTPADVTVFEKDRVAEVRITMAEDDWAAMTAGPLAKRYVPADFSLDVEILRDVAVRPKGSSSLQAVAKLGIPWFGLTVDFNLFNVARNFRGLSKVNLNTGFKYHFLLRARLASELFLEMGVPAPETSYADVWVNNTHLGAYALVEQVDRTFLRRHFPNDAGNLYKPAGLSGSGPAQISPRPMNAASSRLRQTWAAAAWASCSRPWARVARSLPSPARGPVASWPRRTSRLMRTWLTTPRCSGFSKC